MLFLAEIGVVVMVGLFELEVVCMFKVVIVFIGDELVFVVSMFEFY